MKKSGPVHAPRTGPGYSAGQAPPKISNSGDRVSVKNGAGLDVRRSPADPKSTPVMSGGKAGNHAAMRRPYK